MKYTIITAKETAKKVESKPAVIISEELSPKAKQSPISLASLIDNDRKIVAVPKSKSDVNSVIKFADIITPEEFSNANDERAREFAQSDEKSYAVFCASHSIEEYLTDTPKRKRYKVTAYANDPLANALYEYAFKFTAMLLRKKIRWSNFDSRIVDLYCDCLRQTKFESYRDNTQDCVHSAIVGIAEWIDHTAKIQFRDMNAKPEITRVEKSALEKYSVFVVTDGSREMKIDFANNYGLLKAAMKSADAYVSHNNVDKHGKDAKAISDYVENTYDDYKQTRELLRVDESTEWLSRKKEVMETIGQIYPKGEYRVFEAVLNLMHDGIVDIGKNEQITPWQVTQITQYIGNAKVTPFVEYKNMGHGFVADFNAHIKFKDAVGNREEMDLSRIKSILISYLTAFAK